MKDILNTLRPYLEFAAFIANILIVFIAWRGLKQLRLIKYDIKNRDTRSSREQALTACSTYLKDFCKQNEFYDYCKKNDVSSYTGPIGDFSKKSLKMSDREVLSRRYKGPWLHELNTLETIASVFVSEIGDSDLGFKIIGKSFCGTVQRFYDILSFVRDDESINYYNSIVELYKKWSALISATELESARKTIDQKLQQLQPFVTTKKHPVDDI